MRRGVALIVHVLLLQFLLLGAGDACVLSALVPHERPTAVQRVGDADVVTAGMHGRVPTGARADARTSAPCGTADAFAPHVPADRPAPHAPVGCQTLAPCAPAALPADTPPVVASASTLVVRSAPAYVARRPAARTTAPEPPPPRV